MKKLNTIQRKITGFLAVIMAFVFVLNVCGSQVYATEEIVAETKEAETDVELESFETQAAITPTEAFVTRVYETILLRAPDKEGLKFWMDMLTSKSKTGADIISGFISSKEFRNLKYSDEKFIEIMYRAILDRNPDKIGKANWLSVLEAGHTRMYVCSGFVNSIEFRELCAGYGITSGAIAIDNAVDKNPKITEFMIRIYDLILSRKPDPVGLEDWVTKLSTKKITAADVVYGFISSKEFKSKNLSDRDFIEVMYKALLGRSSDAEGRKTWTGYLEHGLTRDFICSGFINSQEFSQLCSSYNIKRGSLELTCIRDKNAPLTVFVADVYMDGLGRKASVQELENWLKPLIGRKMTGYDFVAGVVNSKEYTDRKTSNEAFLKFIHKTVLGSTIGTPEYKADLKLLQQNTPRSKVLEERLSDKVFNNRCIAFGILPKGRCIDPDKPMVALTFDDGPGIYTPGILECLEKNNAVATFFVVGTNAARYESYIKQAYEMGCEIGNHTYNHPTLTALSASSIASQMEMTNQYIRNATGSNAPIMRPPGGANNAAVRSAVGCPVILWSIDTRDWEHRNTQKTVNSVLNNVKDGDIVLMHDIHKPTAAAAEIIIPELVSRGYQLVTVSELAQYRGGMKAGQAYSSFYK